MNDVNLSVYQFTQAIFEHFLALLIVRNKGQIDIRSFHRMADRYIVARVVDLPFLQLAIRPDCLRISASISPLPIESKPEVRLVETPDELHRTMALRERVIPIPSGTKALRRWRKENKVNLPSTADGYYLRHMIILPLVEPDATLKAEFYLHTIITKMKYMIARDKSFSIRLRKEYNHNFNLIEYAKDVFQTNPSCSNCVQDKACPN